MDLPLLRSFLAVADSGSFSGAALKLNLTQSSISHQIARLEAHLGRRLFDRTTRRCSLTVPGRLLLEQARDIIRKVDEAEQQFRPDALRGHLRLGVPDDPHLFSAIATAIAEFLREQPQVTLDIEAGLSHDLNRGLDDGDLDVAILREIPPRNVQNCIISEELIWVGQAGARDPELNTLSLALVDAPCSYRSTAIRVLDEAGIDHRTVISCSSLVAVFAFVEAGLATTVAIRTVIDGFKGLQPISNLPSLPMAGLVFKHRGDRPGLLALGLMARLENAIRGSADI